MFAFPPSLQKLIAEFSKLPSIGEKSAARLAYHLVTSEPEQARSLAGAISSAVANITFCETCWNLSESNRCPVCSDPKRDRTVICVVERPVDVIAIERMGEYRGLYHVLHGLWAPLRGQGPESMKLEELLNRIKNDPVEEVIIATSATVEGDATALYIARLLGEQGVKSSRLAQGMPKGGELEYADEITISRALAGRVAISL